MLALLLACHAPAVEDTAAEDTDRLSAEPVVAEWSADDAAIAMSEHLSLGVVDPRDLPGWFEPLVDGIASAGDPNCPAFTTTDDGAVTAKTMAWMGECGAFGEPFGGVWLYSSRVTTTAESVERGIDGLLSFDFVGEDGVEHVVGAFITASWSTSTDQAHRTLHGTVGGTFRDGSGSAWMADADLGLAVNLTWDQQGGIGGALDGTQTVGDAPGLHYDGVIFDGRGCWEVPVMGSVGVRDPSGGWWRAAFDGTCQPCGPLTFAGTDQGEICVGPEVAAAANALFAHPDPQP